MARKRYAESPLLYVQQPGTNEPKARMQHQYQTPRKEAIPQAGQKHITDTPLKRRSKKTVSKNEQHGSHHEVEEVEEQNSETKQVSTQERDPAKLNKKKFKDMTIEEKTVYLTNRSSHAPVLRCEVKTNDRTYRGVIVSLEEDKINMRVARRTSLTTVKLSHINTINLLGLI